MNKNVRERKEMEALFADPKFFRQALKSIGQAIALQPASKPAIVYDKDGNLTQNTQLETYTYSKLCEDLKTLCKEKREPTELEMIMHCQMVKARTDTQAAIFIRDTLGAKPVDESKVDAQINNPYESLSDEELELIQQRRKQQSLEQQEKALLTDSIKVDSIVDAIPVNCESTDHIVKE